MKNFLTPRRLATAAAIAVCAVLLIAIFSQKPDPEPKKNIPRPSSASQDQPRPEQKMPDGTRRALSMRIPAIGWVHGTRWIPGHQFRRIKENPAAEGPPIALTLDVLVDAEGNFLAARRNGTKYDTRMSDVSMQRLLQYPILQEYMRKQQNPITGTKLPAISRVSPAKVLWDDPLLGDAIKNLMFRGFPSYHPIDEKNDSPNRFTNDRSDAPSRFEDTYLFLEVQFEGESQPRQMVLRRSTDGRMYPALEKGRFVYPVPPPPFLWNTNLYGSGVVYEIMEVRANQPDIYGSPYYLCLTEPWEGPCPWPEERLDPHVGRDRLNEFTFPDEAPAGSMPDLLTYEPRYGDPKRPFVEQASKNKAARMAQEAAGSGLPRR